MVPFEVTYEMITALVDRGDVDEANSSNLDYVSEAIAAAARRDLDLIDRMSAVGGAASTDRCNTRVKSFCRRFELQSFAWPFVQLPGHFVQICLRVYR